MVLNLVNGISLKEISTGCSKLQQIEQGCYLTAFNNIFNNIFQND